MKTLKNELKKAETAGAKKLFSKTAALALLALATATALFVGYSLFPSTRETRIQAVGVDGNGAGSIVEFSLRSRPGGGALLVNVVNAEWRSDTARSFLAAREHAQRILGVPLNNRDYELTVEGTGGVGGESAGAALAAGIVANYFDAPLRGDAVISAALPSFAAAGNETDYGVLAPVGGIDEKIAAAAGAGKRFFLVAQAQEVKYEGELAKRIAIKRVRTLGEAVNFLLAQPPN